VPRVIASQVMAKELRGDHTMPAPIFDEMNRAPTEVRA
jgi:hypothetical protein